MTFHVPTQLRRTIATIALTVTLTVAALVAPISPLALGTADALAGSGHVATSLALYDAIARYAPLDSHAEAAAYRAAMVQAVEPSRERDARRRLLVAVRTYPDSPRAADAWELLGHLAEEPGRTATALANAYRTDPESDRARQRLTGAAAAFVEAGSYGKALAHYGELATAFPDSQARVDVARGRIALLQGRVEASLGYFEAAMPYANDPVARAIAKLGVASCMERLGNLDGALAELDVIDMPDSALAERRKAISERLGMRNND